jgi:lipopolysaccharide export system protein LptA
MKKSSIIFSAVCILQMTLSAVLLPADTFTFKSERMSTVVAEGQERTLLSGNARIVSNETRIEADEIELFGDESRYAVCSGDVTVKDEQQGILLTCDELFFDRERELSRVNGYCEMIDQKNELVVKGGFLENYGEEEITIIQIGVRILKEDMSCRSEFARYRRKDDTLELSGMPYVFWKGDEYQASRIIINLDTDEIRLEGEVQGTITTEEEEESESNE